MTDISIVIVSFNTRELLDKCLESVYQGSGGVTREVIVVENGSVDGSLEMVSEKWPQVKLIVNNENLGYAPACNQGLKASAGRYVMALNSDAFIKGDALREMIAFLDDHPEACAVGPKLLNRDGSLQATCARRQPTVLSLFLYYSRIVTVSSRLAFWALGCYPDEFYSEMQHTGMLCGACILFRPSALREIGYLDDRLFVNYDDAEWCARALKMGRPVMYYPGAEVVHIGGQSRHFEVDKAHLANMQTTFTYFDTALSRPSSALLKMTILASFALQALKNGILAPVSRRRRGLAASRVRLLIQCTRLALKGSR